MDKLVIARKGKSHKSVSLVRDGPTCSVDLAPLVSLEEHGRLRRGV